VIRVAKNARFGINIMIFDLNVIARYVPAPSNRVFNLDILDKPAVNVESSNLRAKNAIAGVPPLFTKQSR